MRILAALLAGFYAFRCLVNAEDVLNVDYGWGAFIIATPLILVSYFTFRAKLRPAARSFIKIACIAEFVGLFAVLTIGFTDGGFEIWGMGAYVVWVTGCLLYYRRSRKRTEAWAARLMLFWAWPVCSGLWLFGLTFFSREVSGTISILIITIYFMRVLFVVCQDKRARLARRAANKHTGNTSKHQAAPEGIDDTEKTRQKFDWDTLVAKLKQAYPEIDPASVKYNDRLKKEVERVQRVNMTNFDLSPSKALCAAAASVIHKARSKKG